MPAWNQILLQLKEVTILSIFTRLLLAALFGGIIGMERLRHRRAAGLRTHVLVCIAATLVMITNQYIVGEFGSGDPSRLGAQVINGIGFLGVGTIIVDREQQQVRGLATAAGLWACACMGLALGIGFYMGAFFTLGIMLASITIFTKTEQLIISKSRYMKLHMEFEAYEQIDRFRALIAQKAIKISQLDIVRSRGPAGAKARRVAAIVTLRLPRGYNHDELLAYLEAAYGPVTIEELRQ